ncbi:MAG: MarR family winged helix-turn-helix transcriptional regulator [Parvibaculaceae bacterium]|nr:MarR family winged helix-turn-helix transcriptional regulator [Parvibaculaceae bacterium]
MTDAVFMKEPVAHEIRSRYFKVEVFYFNLEVKSMTKAPRIFHLLQQANSRLFAAADRQLKAREGIATAHQVILFVLAQENGLASAKIANRAGMSQSRLTGLVDTLVSKGMVRREKADTDSRIHRAFITDQGTALVARTAGQVRDLNEDLLQPFSESERETITRFLKHVSETAKAIDNS